MTAKGPGQAVAYSEASPAGRQTPKRAPGILARAVFAIVAVNGMAGCAEFADAILEELSYCYGCNWIVQEWDDPGWSTHNSDQYATEELCEQSLAEQSRRSPDRGHRCIYEGDLANEQVVSEEVNDFCYGCDWVVETEDYAVWERADSKVHHTEGVCQQALWHLHKRQPEKRFRCTNMDR